MNTKTLFLLFCLSVIVFASCSKDDENSQKRVTDFTEKRIAYANHQMSAYSIINNSKYLIVFESAAGSEGSVWQTKTMNDSTLSIADIAAAKYDVVTYDRLGIGKSEVSTEKRTIEYLTNGLDAIINTYANGRKVILVGHSLGGFIIRNYAIQNPQKVAGLLFVDPSHEQGVDYSQELIEMEINYAIQKGASELDGGICEMRGLIDIISDMKNLSDLPDIPVVVLTSMLLAPEFGVDEAVRKKWSDGHATLAKGVSDFTQIHTQAGHYIHDEDPQLVVDNLLLLISKVENKYK